MKNQEAFTYCWTDHRDNKLYIGYHKGQQDDGYVCNGLYKKHIGRKKKVNWFFEEYSKRPQDFTRMILAEGTAEDCHALETAILVAVDAMHSDKFYNGTNGCGTFVLKHQTDYAKAKLSELKKGIPLALEHRKHLSEANKGRKQSPETIAKRALSLKGRPGGMKGKHHKESSKKKTSDKLKLYKKTPEHCKHLSESLTGKKNSPSKCKKMRTIVTEHWKNPEYRQMMSNAHKGQVPWNIGISDAQVKCPHCGKLGGRSVMSRWHFNNCKHVKAVPLG